jgi:formate-dependent nitrite reductase cytochrome c552 subunit
VEGQGGVAFPINQPGKYSLMRYTKGHAGIACQGCHESIHGLYPVTPEVDKTSYAQAAMYNPDGSHGPLKCAACHETNEAGVPLLAEHDPEAEEEAEKYEWKGKPIENDFEAAVQWMHAYAPDQGGAIPKE